MIRRFDRYVFNECVGPTAIGFFVATALLLVSAFFDLAEAMILRDVPLGPAIKMLALNLPHIVVLTIPMALLFGVMVAIGRLSSDSELTAMRACGVSLLQLIRPIFALSAIFTLLNFFLMVQVLPWGNKTLQAVISEYLIEGSQTQSIEPRIFNEILAGKTLYVFESPPDRSLLQGVFLADAVPLSNFTFTVADEGTIDVENRGERLNVLLRNAVDQTIDLDDPEEAQVSTNENLRLILDLSEGDPAFTRTASRSLRDLTIPELREYRSDLDNPELLRNRASVEIHKKFSIPAACLVFGVISLPMGFSRRARGRSSAFMQALGVLVVYYVLGNITEETGVKGSLDPMLAMWLPNLLFFAFGVVLLLRRNQDKGVLLGAIDRWIQSASWLWSSEERRRLRRSRRPAISPTGTVAASLRVRQRFTVAVPHFSLRFPTRIDRYVLKIFAATGALVFSTSVTLYLIVDLADLLGFVFANDIPWSMVGEYYFYYVLQILYIVAPIGVLLTTLISFGVLSRGSEIVAVKAAGISLYRLTIPAIAAGLIVAAAVAALDYTVLPETNARKIELRTYIKFLDAPNEARRRVTRQWFFGQNPEGGGSIYNYLLYNPERQSMQRFQAFRFDAQYRLTGHLYASQLLRQNGRWVVHNGWARTIAGGTVVKYRELPGPVAIDLREGPDFFSTEIKSSEEMNYFELRRYITQLESSGQKVPELKLQMHNKLATPVVSLVMVFVALPFSFRLGRQGALYGVGIAILIGVVLYAVLALFATLGETAAIPAVVAAWSPDLLFSLLSLYLFLGVRS